MSYYSTTQKLGVGETIKIFNYRNMKRAFTCINDIVEGIYKDMGGAPERMIGEDGLSVSPYAVYNIGGGTPENLLDYVCTLQEELVRDEKVEKINKINKKFSPIQDNEIEEYLSNKEVYTRDLFRRD